MISNEMSAANTRERIPRNLSTWKIVNGMLKSRTEPIKHNINTEYIVIISGAPSLLSSKLGNLTEAHTPIPVNARMTVIAEKRENKTTL